MSDSKLKMYIVVSDDLLPHQVAVATAHGAAACVLAHQDDIWMEEWCNYSFKKIILKTTPEKLYEMSNWPGSSMIEESTLDGKLTCVAFCPINPDRENRFTDLKLYRVDDT